MKAEINKIKILTEKKENRHLSQIEEGDRYVAIDDPKYHWVCERTGDDHWPKFDILQLEPGSFDGFYTVSFWREIPCSEFFENRLSVSILRDDVLLSILPALFLGSKNLNDTTVCEWVKEQMNKRSLSVDDCREKAS